LGTLRLEKSQTPTVTPNPSPLFPPLDKKKIAPGSHLPTPLSAGGERPCSTTSPFFMATVKDPCRKPCPGGVPRTELQLRRARSRATLPPFGGFPYPDPEREPVRGPPPTNHDPFWPGGTPSSDLISTAPCPPRTSRFGPHAGLTGWRGPRRWIIESKWATGPGSPAGAPFSPTPTGKTSSVRPRPWVDGAPSRPFFFSLARFPPPPKPPTCTRPVYPRQGVFLRIEIGQVPGGPRGVPYLCGRGGCVVVPAGTPGPPPFFFGNAARAPGPYHKPISFLFRKRGENPSVPRCGKFSHAPSCPPPPAG